MDRKYSFEPTANLTETVLGDDKRKIYEKGFGNYQTE